MIFQSKKTTKFIVLTQPRSGSTWLIDLLNNHTEVRAFGEIFINRPFTPSSKKYVKPELVPPIRFYDFNQSHSYKRPWITFRYLNMLKDWTGGHNAIGFKLMYNHLQRQPEILKKAVIDRYKLIHLVRTNTLDTILSNKNLKINKSATVLENRKLKQAEKIYLDPSSIVKELDSYEQNINHARKHLRFLPLSVLEIKYEDLCKDTDHILSNIQSFLSLDSPFIAQSNLQKISQGSYIDKIVNYQEVKESLTGTRFSNLL